MDVVRANFPPEEHPYIRFLGCVEQITTADLEDIGTTTPPGSFDHSRAERSQPTDVLRVSYSQCAL